ncbi:MAG: OsmC family protein [Candidatus Helarchaeota archaeon]
MPARAIATLQENITFKVKIKDFPELTMDEPKEFHGDNNGPSSIEFLCTAIAGCQGTSFKFCLDKFGIELNKMIVIAEAEMHHVEENQRKLLRITNLHVTIETELKDPDDKEDLLECFEVYKKYCVVSASIIRGIAMDVKLVDN